MQHKIISINEIPLKVEVAKTEESREKGLMYRNQLDQDCGMLFIFPDSNKRGFWMKNTTIPLSIAFLSESGEILNIEDMHPYDLNTVRSRGDAKCALEVNQGWFKKNGIHSGDRVAGSLVESFSMTKNQLRKILKNIILG